MLQTHTAKTIDMRKEARSGSTPEIITVTSGKGGVGKSSMSVNLAILLRQMGKKVLLIDADIHLGSVDLILGIRPKYTLVDVVRNQVDLDSAIIKTSGGLHVLPTSGVMAELLEKEHKILYHLSAAFARHEQDYDAVILDTSAGISQTVMSFVLGSDKILLLVTPDPASIADAYVIIKLVRQAGSAVPILLTANSVKSYQEGEILHKKMNLMVKKFLNSSIEFGGSILKDDQIAKSVTLQSPFVLHYPNSSSAKSLLLIARKLLKLPTLAVNKHTNFFERFISNKNFAFELQSGGEANK